MVVSPSVEVSKFVKRSGPSPIRVPLYSFNDLKVTLDDAVAEILNLDLEAKQNHTATDVKLTLGYLSSLLGIAGAVYGYSKPFDEGKFVVGLTVLIYIAINAILIQFSLSGNRGAVYRGSFINSSDKHAGTEIVAESDCDPSSHFKYRLTLTVTDGENKQSNSKKKPLKMTIEKSFGQYFDSEGTFVPRLFYQDFVKLVEKILVDSKQKKK